MSTQTTNYKLVKPEYSDYADITVLNENLDIIDEELYGKVEKTDASGTLTVAGWSNKEQTLSMAGLTASKSIIVSVDSTDSDGYDAAKNSNIRLSARGTGTLTFAVDTVPTDAITILVTIFE